MEDVIEALEEVDIKRRRGKEYFVQEQQETLTRVDDHKSTIELKKAIKAAHKAAEVLLDRVRDRRRIPTWPRHTNRILRLLRS